MGRRNKQILMELLVIIAILFAVVKCHGQEKWYKITKNDITVISLQAISGAADGFNQAIVHHGFGAGNQFWDQSVSWKNKYKDYPNDTRAKFPGSKTIFVFATDGFHLTRMIDRSCSIISIGISFSEFKEYNKKDIPKVVLKKIVLSYVANRIFFNTIYNHL